MRHVARLAVVVVLGTMFVATVADAAWQGDFIYASSERWDVTMADETGNSSYFRYSVAVAQVDMVNGFYGGSACVGYDKSEPLAGNEGSLAVRFRHHHVPVSWYGCL